MKNQNFNSDDCAEIHFYNIGCSNCRKVYTNNHKTALDAVREAKEMDLYKNDGGVILCGKCSRITLLANS